MLARRTIIFYSFTTLLIFCALNIGFTQSLKFTEVSQSAGINFMHDYQIENDPVMLKVTAGVAVGDYDNDGFPDIYVETGDVGNNLFYKNKGDGTFIEIGEQMGLNLPNFLGSCPFFVDYDNDGFKDLFIGSLDSQNIRIFKNLDGLEFEELDNSSVLNCHALTYSFCAGDYNKDGFLDLFLTHWLEENAPTHIWKNQTNGSFINVDDALDFSNPFPTQDFTFAGNFTDFNNDGWPDLLIASDFGTSQVWVNDGGENFRHTTDTMVINDENGMGAAIGDYNNDGLLDWFVSSIYDSDGVTEGNWGASGSRLYKNIGDNKFEEVTNESGLRNGSWGWGSSFADFNNDGFLDIIHTNGWPKGSAQFYADSVRLFLSNQDGTFKEVSEECGLLDTKQGRGLSVLDYDQDGDLDVFINNYRDTPSLWRNDLASESNFIAINLLPKTGITAIGAKVHLYANGQQQFRELRCGTNYNSQNPLQLHFGLGQVNWVDSIIVQWPDNSLQKYYQVSGNQFLTIDQNLELVDNTEVIIFPNPFNDWLKIRFRSEGSNDIKVRLFDVKGSLVFENSSYTYKSNSYYFNWENLPLLPPGAYIIQIIENDQVKTTRKMIKHSE